MRTFLNITFNWKLELKMKYLIPSPSNLLYLRNGLEPAVQSWGVNFFPVMFPYCLLPWHSPVVLQMNLEPQEVTKPALIPCRAGFSLFPSLSTIRSRDSFFKREDWCSTPLKPLCPWWWASSCHRFISFSLLSSFQKPFKSCVQIKVI